MAKQKLLEALIARALADEEISYSEVAERLGVSRQAVYRWLADGIPRRRLPGLLDIARIRFADIEQELVSAFAEIQSLPRKR